MPRLILNGAAGRLRRAFLICVKWLVLISAGCALRFRSPVERAADAAALAALHSGVGATVDGRGARNFPYYMHVSHDYVILWHNPPEEWMLGTPDTLQSAIEQSAGRASTAFAHVHMDRLPQVMRTLAGTHLYLANASGLLCEAKVAELLMLGQANTASYGYWRQHEPGFRLPKTRAEIAAAIWDSSEKGGRSLAARVVPVSGQCEGASWARVAVGPPPRLFKAEVATPAWQTAGLTQLKLLLSTPSWQQRLVGYREEHEASPSSPMPDNVTWPWQADAERGVTATVTVFRSDQASARFVTANLQVGNACVGGYRIWAAWSVEGQPPHAKFQLLTQVADPDYALDDQSDNSNYIYPTLLLDVDGDGRLEFLSPEGLLSATPTKPDVYDQTNFMFLPLSTTGDGCVGTSRSLAHD